MELAQFVRRRGPLEAIIYKKLAERAAAERQARKLPPRWEGLPSNNSLPQELADEAGRSDPVRVAKRIVADHYGVPREVMEFRQSRKSLTMPRAVAAYCAHQAAPYINLRRLSYQFCAGDFSFASRSIAKVRKRMEENAVFQADVDMLLRQISLVRPTFAYWGA